jgi:hypothetical protein
MNTFMNTVDRYRGGKSSVVSTGLPRGDRISGAGRPGVLAVSATSGPARRGMPATRPRRPVMSLLDGHAVGWLRRASANSWRQPRRPPRPRLCYRPRPDRLSLPHAGRARRPSAGEARSRRVATGIRSNSAASVMVSSLSWSVMARPFRGCRRCAVTGCKRWWWGRTRQCGFGSVLSLRTGVPGWAFAPI